MAVFENEEAKRKFFYISDEQYFFSNATPVEMMEYYRIVYPGYDESRFHSLMKNFGLDEAQDQYIFQGYEKAAFCYLRNLFWYRVPVL